VNENSDSDATGPTRDAGERAASVDETVVRELGDALFVLDVEQTGDRTVQFQRSNPAHQQLTGLSEAEIRGQTPRALPDNQAATLAANAHRCVDRAETVRYEERLEDATGATRWQTTLTPVVDDGTVTRIVGVCREIVKDRGTEESPGHLDRRLEAVVETMSAAVFLKDTDGRYLLMNRACRELFGVDEDDVVGLTDADILPPDLAESAREEDRQVIESGETVEREMELPSDSGTTLWRTRTAPVYDTTGTVVGVCGVSTDITEQRQREQTLRGMYQISSDRDLDFEEKVTALIELGREYLDLPYGFFTSIDGETQRVVHARGSHDLLQPEESVPLENSYCRKTVESDALVSMRDAEEYLGADDDAYDLFGLGCYIGTKVHVGTELYGTFCFAGPAGRERSFTPDEREIVKLLGQWVRYELEHSRVEDRLETLHEAAQGVLGAESADEVAAIAIEVGREMFDLGLGTCCEYDATVSVLRPLAEATEDPENIGEIQPFDRNNTRIWESFEGGELRTFTDISAVGDAYSGDPPLRSEVHVPLGEQGVLIFCSTENRVFDAMDRQMMQLLGRLVRDGLIAAERNEQLAIRSDALQRQNERLEEFVSVVAHDLRNPLTGALSSLEVATETGEQRWFDKTEQALWRMNELVDELLAIARDKQEDTVESEVSLRALAGEAWSHIDAPDATLAVADDTGAVRGDEVRLLQLFGNLFRNSVEHAGEGVTVEVGPLPDDSGFYVADDGPGLPADVLIAVREYDEVGSMTAGGIGLVSVVDVVDAHGWELSVSNPETGVRFEVRAD